MKKISIIISLIFCLNINAQQTSSVYFKNDAYLLTDEQKKSLKEFIDQFGAQTFSIIGYTDTNGTIIYNQRLAKQRANSVKNYFLSNGIDSNQITKIIGKGEDSTFKDLSKNRRVDIVIEIKDSTILINNQAEVVIETQVDTTEKNKVNVQNTAPKSSELSDITNLNVGETLVLENLNFIPGRHFPTAYSEKTLKKLVRILKQNPTLKIEIQGHICCQPGGGDGIDNDTGELTLSINRAKYVYAYLIGQGIDASRLSYVGFGASRPLVKEIDEETRQMNRRVEILIIEK